MAKHKFIADPSEPIEKQERLFEQPGYKPSSLRVHPDIDRSLSGLRHVLAAPDTDKGIDLEFDEHYRPTIVSVTLRGYISSVKWGPEVASLLTPAFASPRTQWIAHSGISADRPVVHKALGIHTVLDRWEDSMITHYLCNQHLTKAPQKDESDDAGAAGFMNLWAAASITTDLYNWKTCRGTVCEGPCPAHDPVGYCGVDSWAGLEIFSENREMMKTFGVPWQFYREQMELAEICYNMELAGVKVDVPYAKAMDAQAELMKEKLFEYSYPAGYEDKLRGEAVTLGLKREEDIIHYILEKGKKKRTYELFNPRAPKQMAEWFEKQGLTLKSAQKDDILTALEVQIREETGCDSLKSWEEASAGSESDEPSFLLQQLHNVYRFKSEGKGLDPWFADKYLSKDGFIHPRFIPVGASTGRLSSSRPNMMNVPARGFGDLVRKAIIPRDESLELLKADFGQLELRMCVAPDTKILTSDLKWVNAIDVKEGMELIGFDEKQSNGNTGVRYRRSNVLASGPVCQKSIRMVTDKGELVGAEDHFVVVIRNGRAGKSSRQWVMMKDIKEGDRLPFTSKPWEEDQSREAGYLAGLLDGEGWLSKVGVGFAQNAGIVQDRFIKSMQARGCKTSSWLCKPSPCGKKPHMKTFVTTGMWQTARLLGELRPSRLLAKSALTWENRRAWGGKNTSYATVSAVEAVGRRNLCAITTDTKTYFANGFFSHNCLYLAGVSPNILGADAFLWLVDQSDGQFSKAAETLDPVGYGKDPRKAARNVAKRISHAGDYLEGFQLLDPIDLQKPRILREIEVGARAVYTRKYYPQLKKDWTFQGKVVSFTGVNLGITLFGDKSFESRAKALAIQEGIYFKRFWMLREWHMSVTDEIENRGYLKMPTGTFVRLFGRGEDRAKVAVATLGQGVAAHHVQAIMLKYRRETGTIPLFQVHDELVWEIPRDLSDQAALEFVEIMRGETWRLADFAVPSDAKRGKNWKDLRNLE